MIYLLTAIGLLPGGSTHLHTNNTQNNKNNNRTTQITTNVEKCGPCPVFASFTLTFALQLRKNTEKPQSGQEKPQSEYSIHITKTPTHYKTLTNRRITTPPPHTHTHARTHAPYIAVNCIQLPVPFIYSPPCIRTLEVYCCDVT